MAAATAHVPVSATVPVEREPQQQSIDEQVPSQQLPLQQLQQRGPAVQPSYSSSYSFCAQALQALEISFSPLVIRESRMADLLMGSLSAMELSVQKVLREVMSCQEGSIAHSQHIIRDNLSLDVVPFAHGRKTGYDVHELPKDDERRLAVQALFLFILRPHIPLKYHDITTFGQAYPEMATYSTLEQERLRITANWMDLAFYTLPPKNNKTFLMNLVPRICEGRYARYVS